MVTRIRLALVAMVAAFGLLVATNGTVKADDKKCESCAVVKKVVESMRCEKCKDKDKPCEKCDEAIKKLEAKMQECCKDGKECQVCKDIASAKCKECAVKKAIIEHTYCCANCEKAGEEKAAKCKKCKEQRAALEARFPKCEACAKEKAK